MKKYILAYIAYLEEVCKMDKKALYEISLYKLTSADNYDADDLLFIKINFDLGIDIFSYHVFEKSIKMKKLLCN
jgi:hypothetical protein